MPRLAGVRGLSIRNPGSQTPRLVLAALSWSVYANRLTIVNPGILTSGLLLAAEVSLGQYTDHQQSTNLAMQASVGWA